jgi:hypothetical protein
VNENPLDPAGYEALSDFYEHEGDADRSALMAELSSAIEGDPNAAPLVPRLILSARDRAALRHSALRGEAGELLSLSGAALVRLFPARGRAANSKVPFLLDAGRGAAHTAEALFAAVRILGLRAPDIFVSEDNGPPFSLVCTTAPRLLVGRLAVKQELAAAELRFFAGRALFSQNPDLLVLRSLRREQLERALEVLEDALGPRPSTLEAKTVRASLSRRAAARVTALLRATPRSLDLGRLADAARHSANRAGLLVAGGIAPALTALRAKKALENELIELVRFASSDRYLAMRSRRRSR